MFALSIKNLRKFTVAYGGFHENVTCFTQCDLNKVIGYEVHWSFFCNKENCSVEIKVC